MPVHDRANGELTKGIPSRRSREKKKKERGKGKNKGTQGKEKRKKRIPNAYAENKIARYATRERTRV